MTMDGDDSDSTADAMSWVWLIGVVLIPFVAVYGLARKAWRAVRGLFRRMRARP